jgi:hypothetical protein
MLLVIAAIAIAASARAHDWWGNGNVVDQATKNLCCGQNDCKEVPAADVIQPGADHRWHFRDTHFAIDVSRAMPSPDGRYWRCIWNGEIKCFFGTRLTSRTVDDLAARPRLVSSGPGAGRELGDSTDWKIAQPGQD